MLLAGIRVADNLKQVFVNYGNTVSSARLIPWYKSSSTDFPDDLTLKQYLASVACQLQCFSLVQAIARASVAWTRCFSHFLQSV